MFSQNMVIRNDVELWLMYRMLSLYGLKAPDSETKPPKSLGLPNPKLPEFQLYYLIVI